MGAVVWGPPRAAEPAKADPVARRARRRPHPEVRAVRSPDPMSDRAAHPAEIGASQPLRVSPPRRLARVPRAGSPFAPAPKDWRVERRESLEPPRGERSQS